MKTNEAVVEDAPAAEERKRKPLPRGRVTVFDNWCKGCGLCIAFCPQEVFEENHEGHPDVAHPELCTACMWCQFHCPDVAIIVERLDERKVRR